MPDDDALRRYARSIAEHLSPRWRAGDVVQLNPETVRDWAAGCFMTITEPKGFGALGFVQLPGQGRAFYRANDDDMQLIGEAAWLPDHEEDLE